MDRRQPDAGPMCPASAAAELAGYEQFTCRSHHRRVARPGLRARPRPGRRRLLAGHRCAGGGAAARRRGRPGRGPARRRPTAAAPAVVALPGDIADPAHRAALRAAAADLGGPSLLVNNAGTLGASPLPALADYPVAALRRVFEVNVVAPVALTQLLLPDAAPRQRRGRCPSPRTPRSRPYAGWGGYGAAKAALEQASNVLAAEEPAVRVWWVDPGDLRTRMHQEAFPGEDICDRPLPETVGAARFLRLLAERPASAAGTGPPT